MFASVGEGCFLINLVQCIEWVVNEVWADLLKNKRQNAIVSSFDDIRSDFRDFGVCIDACLGRGEHWWYEFERVMNTLWVLVN